MTTPDTAPGVRVWDGRTLTPGDEVPGRSIQVADSWLVDDGRVRAQAAHHDRFVGSCVHEAGLPAAVVREFLAAVTTAIPATGRWFPRVEYTGSGELIARMRPAPPTRDGIVLTHRHGDPRRKPRVKGPDLDLMLALRESAAGIGADEVVLLSETGLVIEGALSSIVWWRDDMLCVPDESLPTLNSVTRGLVTALADRRGVRLRPERAELTSLAGLEVWSLSALHGIRPATGWRHRDLSPRPAPSRRAAAWQADLLALAEPVTAPERGDDRRRPRSS